jgi:hypothetical protein
MTKQRTFYVGDEKITIKTRQKTHLGNFYGWSVNINGSQFNILNVLHKQEAEDRAFAKWLDAKEVDDIVSRRLTTAT